jgi:small subunit ribosomal protein S16
VIEYVGTYNPIPIKDGTKEITADADRVRYWLKNGAQPSDRVAFLFGKVGLLPPAPVRQSTKFIIPKSIQKES